MQFNFTNYISINVMINEERLGEQSELTNVLTKSCCFKFEIYKS